MTGQQATRDDALAAAATPRWCKVLVSVLVSAHLAAVFVPPFRFASLSAPNAGSPVAMDLLEWMRPYTDAAYLDHGYFYFAPNPGASHLVKYEATDPDGSRREYVFPDLERQWPRLLYHRHFMLSETFHRSFAPPEPPSDLPDDPELREEELRRWRDARRAYETMRESIENHLSRVHGQPITVTRVEHRPPSPTEAAEGMRLNDPSLFVDLSEAGEPVEQPPPALAPPLPFTPFGPLRPAAPPEEIGPGAKP